MFVEDLKPRVWLFLAEGERLRLMLPSFSMERERLEVLKTVLRSPLMSFDFYYRLAKLGRS